MGNRDTTLAKDIDPYDPDLSELMQKKARQTNPLRLVEEIETLHAGLHDMKATNFILLVRMREIRAALMSVMDGDGTHTYTSPLTRILLDIEKAEEEAKGNPI
tara:strand:+ start:2286 stop:2594 length:309 start_codon:yes stop_codon:yes gene_type:complete